MTRKNSGNAGWPPEKLPKNRIIDLGGHSKCGMSRKDQRCQGSRYTACDTSHPEQTTLAMPEICTHRWRVVPKCQLLSFSEFQGNAAGMKVPCQQFLAWRAAGALAAPLCSLQRRDGICTAPGQRAVADGGGRRAGQPASRVLSPHQARHRPHRAHRPGQEQAPALCCERQGGPPDQRRVMGHRARGVAYPSRSRRRHPPCRPGSLWQHVPRRTHVRAH